MTTEFTITQLTSKGGSAGGVFDTLMVSVGAHVKDEFLAGRIKGAEYATTYLGAMQLAMQTALSFLLTQRKSALEGDLLEAQIAQAAAQTSQIDAQTTQISAQTELVEQQKANAVIEGTVLTAQECKLRAEYELTLATITKTNGETSLLAQKVATERAQVTALGVDEDSVVGRQKALYLAQTNGFIRDAEQKAAKILVDSWSVRRTTDEATVADATNLLNDATVGRAVTKLLDGVSA